MSTGRQCTLPAKINRYNLPVLSLQGNEKRDPVFEERQRIVKHLMKLDKELV